MENQTETIEETVKKRIRELIQEGMWLKQTNRNGQQKDNEHGYKCKGWLTASQNAVYYAITNESNPYRKAIDTIANSPTNLLIPEKVGEATSILESLLKDLDCGLVKRISEEVTALTYDNFLDHAKSYLEQNKKDPAGVIAGVVFEDSIRSTCRKVGIVENGIKLDTLIDELAKVGKLTGTKAKRAKAAAAVRTSATHARWEEFTKEDAEATIKFTAECIEAFQN